MAKPELPSYMQTDLAAVSVSISICSLTCAYPLLGILMSTDDLKTLWLCERKRRELLWALERLRPGAEDAKPLLTELEDIDLQDLEYPIGDTHSMSVDELRERVSETEFPGSDGHTFVIVLDQHIPPALALTIRSSVRFLFTTAARQLCN